VLATLIGSLVGGTLFAPGLGTLMGLTVFDALSNVPLIGLGWMAMMGAVQWIALRLTPAEGFQADRPAA
jgi:hypothetical protein